MHLCPSILVKTNTISPFIIDDIFFLFKLKIKKIQFHHLLSIIHFYYLNPMRRLFFYIINLMRFIVV